VFAVSGRSQLDNLFHDVLLNASTCASACDDKVASTISIFADTMN